MPPAENRRLYAVSSVGLASGPGQINTPTTAYSTGGGDGPMDPRVDVLENEVKHINKSLDQLTSDFRDLRRDMNGGFSELRSEGRSHFRWTLGLIVVPLVLAALKYLGIFPIQLTNP